MKSLVKSSCNLSSLYIHKIDLLGKLKNKKTWLPLQYSVFWSCDHKSKNMLVFAVFYKIKGKMSDVLINHHESEHLTLILQHQHNNFMSFKTNNSFSGLVTFEVNI